MALSKLENEITTIENDSFGALHAMMLRATQVRTLMIHEVFGLESQTRTHLDFVHNSILQVEKVISAIWDELAIEGLPRSFHNVCLCDVCKLQVIENGWLQEEIVIDVEIKEPDFLGQRRTFSKFKDLPPEIRRQIWDMADVTSQDSEVVEVASAARFVHFFLFNITHKYS